MTVDKNLRISNVFVNYAHSSNPLISAIHDMVIQDRQIMERIKSLGYPDNITPEGLFKVAFTELNKEPKKYHNFLEGFKDFKEYYLLEAAVFLKESWDVFKDNRAGFINRERRIIQIMELFLQRNIYFFSLVISKDMDIPEVIFPKSI